MSRRSGSSSGLPLLSSAERRMCRAIVLEFPDSSLARLLAIPLMKNERVSPEHLAAVPILSFRDLRLRRAQLTVWLDELMRTSGQSVGDGSIPHGEKPAFMRALRARAAPVFRAVEALREDDSVIAEMGETGRRERRARLAIPGAASCSSAPSAAGGRSGIDQEDTRCMQTAILSQRLLNPETDVVEGEEAEWMVEQGKKAIRTASTLEETACDVRRRDAETAEKARAEMSSLRVPNLAMCERACARVINPETARECVRVQAASLRKHAAWLGAEEETESPRFVVNLPNPQQESDDSFNLSGILALVLNAIVQQCTSAKHFFAVLSDEALPVSLHDRSSDRTFTDPNQILNAMFILAAKLDVRVDLSHTNVCDFVHTVSNPAVCDVDVHNYVTLPLKLRLPGGVEQGGGGEGGGGRGIGGVKSAGVAPMPVSQTPAHPSVELPGVEDSDSAKDTLEEILRRRKEQTERIRRRHAPPALSTIGTTSAEDFRTVA